MKAEIRKDKFYRSRGATTMLLTISCSKCGVHVCTYQKDGTGNLHRLYWDRIMESSEQFHIPPYHKSGSLKELPNLVCSCRNIIAVPMVYKKEGRLALRLIHGSIHKSKIS